MQQLKGGTSIRGGISPLRVAKCNITAGLKPETSQRTIDDTRSSEVCIDDRKHIMHIILFHLLATSDRTCRWWLNWFI